MHRGRGGELSCQMLHSDWSFPLLAPPPCQMLHSDLSFPNEKTRVGREAIGFVTERERTNQRAAVGEEEEE